MSLGFVDSRTAELLRPRCGRLLSGDAPSKCVRVSWLCFGSNSPAPGRTSPLHQAEKTPCGNRLHGVDHTTSEPSDGVSRQPGTVRGSAALPTANPAARTPCEFAWPRR